LEIDLSFSTQCWRRIWFCVRCEYYNSITVFQNCLIRLQINDAAKWKSRVCFFYIKQIHIVLLDRQNIRSMWKGAKDEMYQIFSCFDCCSHSKVSLSNTEIGLSFWTQCWWRIWFCVRFKYYNSITVFQNCLIRLQINDAAKWKSRVCFILNKFILVSLIGKI